MIIAMSTKMTTFLAEATCMGRYGHEGATFATRYDRTAAVFLGSIHLAASVMWFL
ncbi:hypothetical protein [Sphingomonas pokkalii]|uniref:hypothetical protein n=1 Tax=Sphingomonas pokkalii TaxID=2175090 RepID=UPI001402485F|nr:hypothetical protein [Sphingomonas pokkalii]